MSDQSKKTIDILRDNLTALLSREDAVSMRQLSLSIGASDSYIQKLLTDQASPSLKKVDALGSFFGLDTWTLFCDFDEAAGDSLEILQLINRLPQSVRPNVMEYIKFLLKQYEEVLQKMNNENQ